MELEFLDRDHAMLWVLRTQLGRRNLSDLDFKLLVGQQLELEKKVEGGDKKSEEYKKSHGQSGHVVSSGLTRNRIAKEHNTSPRTVARSAELYNAVEAVKEVSPEVGRRLQSGEIKVPEKDIRAVGKALKQADSDQKKQIVSELNEDFKKAT